jgi:putative hydrolase of the HAD superfamily
MNIVFDLCGVVFSWTPEAILANAAVAPELHDQVRAGLFTYPDWIELDRGTLPHPEAIRRSAAHTGLSASTVAELLPLIPLSLVVMPATVDLLQRLKAAGHRLFYLSNMNTDCIEYIERTHAFWQVFEGGIASCRVHLIKPEPAIYTALLNTYGLESSESLFIDDSQANLVTARECGIQTIHFEQPEQCEQELMVCSILSLRKGQPSATSA